MGLPDRYDNEGIVACIENQADIRVVQGCYGSGFLPETLAVLLLDLLDCHNAAQARITLFPHFSHTTGADAFEGFVWAEFAS